MSGQKTVSFPGEAKLRKAFGLIKTWSARGLINRLLEEDIDLPSRNAAYILIGAGTEAGLLLRSGRHGDFSYTLNPDWQRPGGSKPGNGYALRRTPSGEYTVERIRAESPPAKTYAGPAFARGSLAPVLGRRAHEGVDADGELLPCIGGRIADQLDGQFRAVFGGLE